MVVCKMLCAVCLSMFSKDEFEGPHHTSLENLQRAAQGGCKICIYLVLQHESLGKLVPDPVTPFLRYRWSPYGTPKVKDRLSVREIRFDSQFCCLEPWIDVHASHTGEPVPEWYLNVSRKAASDLDS